jgi:dephospho-CoA kinase
LIKVGITGGIGAGKSFVCSIFERLGYPVFYSDEAAKNIIDSDVEVQLQFEQLFGNHIFIAKQLDRTLLASIIFNDKEALEKINSIVHPKVRKAFDVWSEQQKSEIVFNEAAVLFETGAYKKFDTTILVTAPNDLKISRVRNRDRVSADEIQRRMDNQWTDEQKGKLANFILLNDEQTPLIRQIEEVISQIALNDLEQKQN